MKWKPEDLRRIAETDDLAAVALGWLLHNPAVTAPIIGPRTREQLTGSLRALEIALSNDTNRRLDEIWLGPGGQAPKAIHNAVRYTAEGGRIEIAVERDPPHAGAHSSPISR